ncbi:hypothetical protein CDAR_574791 [Caerostris darwini]|uniref:Uncharacterized protein n=1 Tax=Caerostris darwini TaxID=1538125 RepID=A0AAV4SW46_9ARAC|nr:hypothetical protein CDAR_574791 [Caerostris darwini]
MRYTRHPLYSGAVLSPAHNGAILAQVSWHVVEHVECPWVSPLEVHRPSHRVVQCPLECVGLGIRFHVASDVHTLTLDHVEGRCLWKAADGGIWKMTKILNK